MNSSSIHAMLDQAIAESIKEDPNMAPWHDWTYKDLPRMDPKLMEQFQANVGEDNLKWLTFADYGNSVRGQVLISPEGMDNIRKWVESQ